MSKIRVEFEIPKDDCRDCRVFDRRCEYCDLFQRFLSYDKNADKFLRCLECKNAEINEDKDVNRQVRQAKVDVLDEVLNKIWNVGNGHDCSKIIKEIKAKYEY